MRRFLFISFLFVVNVGLSAEAPIDVINVLTGSDHDAIYSYKYGVDTPFGLMAEVDLQGLSNPYTSYESASSIVVDGTNWFPVQINTYIDDDWSNNGDLDINVSVYHRYAYDVYTLAATDWILAGTSYNHDGGASGWDGKLEAEILYPLSWEHLMVQWKVFAEDTDDGGIDSATSTVVVFGTVATFTPTPTPTRTPTSTFTPPSTPTFTRTPTKTPTSTWIPTNTKTPTNTPTLTPTFTSTYTPTNTPTIESGVRNVKISEIICLDSINIGSFSVLAVRLRNTGSLIPGSSYIVDVSDVTSNTRFSTWPIEASAPAPGDSMDLTTFLTTVGATAGEHTIRAAINLSDDSSSDNELTKSVTFISITPTPTNTPTHTPTFTHTPTKTSTPTHTPTSTPTSTATTTPTIIPTAITAVNSDLELNLWEGGVRAGAVHGAILGVTHEFSTVPPTNGVVIDDLIYGFRLGDIIRVGDILYLLVDVHGYREWLPINYDLYERVDDLEASGSEVEDDVTITYKGNDLYWFSYEFEEEASTLWVPFPPNKQLDTAISFLVLIGGFQFEGHVRYGLGGRQDGMQFSLTNSTWLPGTKASGQFTLTDYTPWTVTVSDEDEELVNPSTQLGVRMEGSMVEIK